MIRSDSSEANTTTLTSPAITGPGGNRGDQQAHGSACRTSTQRPWRSTPQTTPFDD